MLFAVLSGCVSSSQGLPPQEIEVLGSEGKRQSLEDLALLYDDTIITRSARTVDFNGQAVIPRYRYTDLNKGDRDLTVQLLTTRVVFGLNENTTLGLTIPYVSKRLESTSGTMHSDGLGDVPITGKHRFFQDTGLGETTEAAKDTLLKRRSFDESCLAVCSNLACHTRV